jgi:hypothetical protein
MICASLAFVIPGSRLSTRPGMTAERGAPRNDGGAIQHEWKRWQLHSGLMFAALMIGHHFWISAM